MGGNNNSLPVAKPFLKWAGSKRWLIPHLEQFIPQEYNRYFEPFLGSGAIFFAIRPERVQLSDLNKSVILTYRAIKKRPDKVINNLRKLKAKYAKDKQYYYYVRDDYSPSSEAGKAARIIFLNRTCWNGLYRENSKGEFNVPVGSYVKPKICDKENLKAVASAIKKVKFKDCDFKKAVKNARAGDFVFFDPPYITGHSNNGFHAYNEKLFKWKDQERLAKVASDLDSRGCYVLITNANNRKIKELYKHFNIRSISRHSIIAANVEHRKKVRELIIKNY